jgi:3-hydroxyisobutyrate dehydrogenase-like beta-hydroxyacid dehydrogenase
VSSVDDETPSGGGPVRIRRIGVIGLGAMGTPLATRAARAGYDVRGYDIVSKRMTALAHRGVGRARSARAVAEGADLVVLSLPHWPAVREVMEGENGILPVLGKGQIVADTSTVPPWETRAMGQRLAGRGVEWMDVPISGSAAQAVTGQLVFMASGSKVAFRRVKPVLDRVGKKTVHVGGHGAASTLKLVVNQTLFINQAAAIEGFVHGLKAGLDPDVMLDVMVSGAAGSDLISARGGDMLAGNFEAKGSLAVAVKDLGLALESARRLGVVLPVAALYQQVLLTAHYRSWDRQDATVVMRVYEQLADLERKARARTTRPQRHRR